MEASLTCAVCLSLFEEPVTLPVCSHNFCRPCVIEYLSQAQGTVEPPSATAAAASRPARRAHDHPQETGQASGLAPRHGDSVTVSCPLCRKLNPLPSDGGAAALPVNTTLAEVVKLFKATLPAKASQEATPEEASSALAPQLAVLGVPCKKHPGRSLQLYCRRCLRGACGQCVSEEHHGIFHSVNLFDTVYQEEKLAFFSNLKKIRDIYENMIKEIPVSPNSAGVVMLNEEEIIKIEFDKVYNALEVRKKQLLEDVEVQKKRKLKESLIWNRMKDVHKKTIENVLNDCEKLLNEYNPQRFLEVACSLNQRMKTQLDLMQIACSHGNQSECKQVQMDTTDIVNDILALNLTAVDLDVVKADIPSRDVEHSISASPGSKLEVKENVQKTTYEMRYNYYMKHQVCLDELQAQISPQNENFPLLKCLSSKSATSRFVPSCLSAKAKNKKKIATLQRPCFSESGVSNPLGFTFNAEAMNFNFCSSNNKLNLQRVNQSQNDAKETSQSAVSNSCQNTTKLLQPHVVTLSSEDLISSTVFPKVSESAAVSVAAVNPCISGAVSGHSASPFIFGPSGNLGTTPSSKKSSVMFEKEKVAFSTLSLVRSESQDCNINNINVYNSTNGFLTVATTVSTISPKSGTAVSGNPFLSTFPANSESDSCQTTTVSSSSEQKSFSYLIADQKILQGNKAVCFRKQNNEGNSWVTYSAIDSNKHLIYSSNDAFSMACTTSSFTASHMIDTSEKQPIPDSVSSKNDCSTNGIHLLPLKRGNKNCGDTLISIKPLKKIECATEKSKVKPEDKNVTVQRSVPSKKDVAAYKELKDIRNCSSLASINKCPKAKTCSVLVPQQNVAHDLTVNSTSDSVKLTEMENSLEIFPPAVEDHKVFSSVLDGASCTVNSDSDVEDLSQASNVSDSSSTSEYFSVTEDQISC
uniref:Uncharacterized protein isoform X3 n=1 Tax=Pogona vitticeps TaxID=103695 RepID=A0ABM5GIU3_9SAUR